MRLLLGDCLKAGLRRTDCKDTDKEKPCQQFCIPCRANVEQATR
nr:MAG TPA: hypothetical protein [Caudoviricetes sp.]